MAGRSGAIISQNFAIKFVGRSNCRARKIKNNSNILSETASDKTCAGQALNFSSLPSTHDVQSVLPSMLDAHHFRRLLGAQHSARVPTRLAAFAPALTSTSRITTSQPSLRLRCSCSLSASQCVFGFAIPFCHILRHCISPIRSRRTFYLIFLVTTVSTS